jgi:hypothetical protein
MDVLILTPPVCPPTEPAAGAFLLAAGLTARGVDVALLDLSLELFHRELARPGPGPDPARHLRYLLESAGGYDPARHREAAGALHARLAGFAEANPGWRLSLMDLEPPGRVHDPRALSAALSGASPFEALWEEVLDPVLAGHRPRTVAISLAYLAQLPAAIDLARHLERRGIRPVVGGSLPGSLARTGQGLAALGEVFADLSDDDGLALAGGGPGRLLDRLAWPALLSGKPYLSARPVVPLALSSGCCWRRCLFCPDRVAPFFRVPPAAVEGLLDTLPGPVAAAGPLIHLVDSALPIPALRGFLPVARRHGVSFYGFARPDRALGDPALLAEAAESGLVMLQLGVESGSGRLLDRFDKGLDPDTAFAAVENAARAGIRTYVYLLLGLPGETDADREATRERLEAIAASVDFLNVSLFNLPAHCELADRAAEFGLEIGRFPGGDDRLRLYLPFATAGGSSPREEARAWKRARFDRHPPIRAALARTPRWLRAAHLALMRLPGRHGPRSRRS